MSKSKKLAKSVDTARDKRTEVFAPNPVLPPLQLDEPKVSVTRDRVTFTTAKNDFDEVHRNAKTAKCIVPVNGKSRDIMSIKDTHGRPSEEYYKWQLIYALIHSGLYARDFVGVEIQFPKGNSAILRLDGAIFDSGDWLQHYNAYWKDRRSSDLEWLIGFQEMKGYRLPTPRPARAERGDVLVSTVRTYRKGIGLVTDDGDNLVTTNAMLNLCAATDFAPGVTLPYVYAFLRSDFFVEQVWSQLNRGVYPRMDAGALAKIVLPVADDKEVCSYIAALALVIAEKERAIRIRNDEIHAVIEDELAVNQAGKFRYEYPQLDEILSLGRLDAAIYSEEYKSKIARIKNYRHGWQTPSEAGFTITPGPSLEIKLLLTRLDSETPKPGFYQLLIPANISEYGTMDAVTWLGTARKLPLLRAGDILFGEAGFHKGRSIVLIDQPERATTNAHGLYARRSDGDLAHSIFFRCIFHWYRKQRLIDLMAVGGSGGHFSPDYFDSVLIPKFPEPLQRRIVALYHNPAPQPASPVSVANFVGWHREWNQGLGIWELDRELKSLQRTLVEVQERTIEGRTVALPF